MEPDIPRAKNAVFRQLPASRNLEFSKMMWDRPRPDDEHGHVSSAPGDSGGPFWKTYANGVSELVAILHGGAKPDNEPVGYYANNEEDLKNYRQIYKCSSMATKITPQIIQWAKNKDDSILY